jgi:hypothetical protein
METGGIKTFASVISLPTGSASRRQPRHIQDNEVNSLHSEADVKVL